MQYDKYTIRTTTAAEDIVAAGLFDVGITGVQIENHVPLSDDEIGEMFIDFPPELSEDDGSSEVIFYLESDMPADERKLLLGRVSELLSGLKATCELGEGSISTEKTEDADWLNNWKAFFSSFKIGDILIRPSWEEVDDTDRKLEIVIDPGVSFGTGKHETTYMCIEAMQRHLKPGFKVLDAGCGSGILSVAAVKLGAAHVLGLDVDGDCITSSYENTDRNGIDRGSCDFRKLNLLSEEEFEAAESLKPEGGYDLIAANILADVLIPMMPAFKALLKENGILIMSGIIDFKEKAVTEAAEENGFSVSEINHMGEWVEVTCINSL